VVNPATVKANADLYATESSLQYEQRPEWMKRWEKTGLLKFEDKNGDGRIQYYNDKTKSADAKAKAEAAGWKGNELTVNADIMVMANPEIALLPNWVIALVAAGGLAAALSTAAGLLMAISSAVSHDLVKNVFVPNISDKNELLVGKISMAVAIVISGWLGLNPPGFAAGTVALAFGIAASSLFPAIMMGIFSKKMNKEGAIAGMLAGLRHAVLRVCAQGHLLREGHRLRGHDRRSEQLLRHHAGSLRCGRRDGELHRCDRGRQGDQGAAGAHPAHGRGGAHPARFEAGGRRSLSRVRQLSGSTIRLAPDGANGAPPVGLAGLFLSGKWYRAGRRADRRSCWSRE
jgi:hypothetical protein